MINASHPGTTPHDTETASDPDSATGQAGTIGDWAAGLEKLLGAAFREVDTDRECAKVSVAKASLLLRVQIERSSFESSRSPGMAKGFTLYMLRAETSGRGDEVVSLAKTCLWR